MLIYAFILIKNALNDLVQFSYNYYAIVHNKDVDDLNQLKRAHLHIVLCSCSRVQAKKVLNDLSLIFNTNVSNIQLLDCPDIPSAVQYLTHKNDIRKYQYSFNDIITNQSRNDLKNIYDLNLSVYVLCTDNLIDACASCNSRIELIKRIGIGNYQAFRQTINDIINSLGLTY